MNLIRVLLNCGLAAIYCILQVCPLPGVKRTAIGSRRGLRAVRRQPATPINHVQPPSSTPPSSPLPSLPTPLTHDVIRGLLAYAISLIEQKNWGMLPVVCKVLVYCTCTCTSQTSTLSTLSVSVCKLSLSIGVCVCVYTCTVASLITTPPLSGHLHCHQDTLLFRTVHSWCPVAGVCNPHAGDNSLV